MDKAVALMEARWQADRERCWQMFLRNAQRISEAPEGHQVKLLAQYQTEAKGAMASVQGLTWLHRSEIGSAPVDYIECTQPNVPLINNQRKSNAWNRR